MEQVVSAGNCVKLHSCAHLQFPVDLLLLTVHVMVQGLLGHIPTLL
jgi:hypothetical protein